MGKNKKIKLDEQNTLGERLKFLREHSKGNPTKKDIADYLGITMQGYSNYENGREPSIGIVVKLADYYGLSVDSLITGTYEPSEQFIEEKTGLSSESVRILKRINKYCKDREISNPVNLLIEKKEFQECIDELNCSTILMLSDRQGSADEGTRKTVHKLNLLHILSGGDPYMYQGKMLELARLHTEDAKTFINTAIDKIRTEV